MVISIILVNWNSADYLRNCLESIYSNPAPSNMEVVVVDNASYDGSEKMVREQFPQVCFVQSEENLGFARGNNLGVKASSGSILLFLNPDTLIRSAAMTEMARNLDLLPKAGAVGCRILNQDGSIQTSAVQSFPTILNQALDFEPLRRRFPDSGLWGMNALFTSGTEPVPVHMVSGACLAVKRSVFEQVGEFSPEYFMYGEDVDLCKKISTAGFRIYYLPTASIVHFGGQSAKQQRASTFPVLCMQQSMQTYIRKFHGNAYVVAYRLSRAAVAFLRVIVVGVLLLLPAREGTRQRRKSIFEKWWTVLRWSVGVLKLPTGNSKAGIDGQVSGKNPTPAGQSSSRLI